MQTNKLLHQKIQRNGRQVKIEKILQVVPETHGTQRGEEVKKPLPQ